MKKILYSLLAVGALATSAFATPASGDLIIGFYTSAGTGSGTNIMIDAGQFSQFLAGNGSTFSIGGFSATDLANTYSTGGGSNWYDRTDLSWGVIGAIKPTQSGVLAANSQGFGAVKDTLFATAQAGFGNTSAQSLGANVINPIYTYLAGSTVNGVGSATYIVPTASGVAGSFIQEKNAAANLDFKYFTSNSVMTYSMPGVVGTATQDLYETIPSGVSGTTGGVYKLGTFALTSSGMTFTDVGTAAIPEPSTYAMIAGAIMLGFVALRRRFQTKA